ncbi:beta strand repeat-containing protein, partial [Spirosoma migulaei]
GLIPDGLNRIVKVSLPGCGTTSAAFTAPTACTATPAPVCSVSALATTGVCQTATNTYSSRVVINLTNPITGTLTVTNGAQTQTLATSPVTTSLTAVFANLISDGASHTVLVSLPGCSTTSTTYTAPASCSVAPVCSISAVATAGLCATATNTYSALVVVNLANAQAGTLTVSIPGATSVSQAVSSGSSSLTLTLPGLLSDGVSHTATVSLPGCGTTTATFTAPASCSVAPVCSVSAVATAGLCSTATNTYSTSVVITLANPTTGTLTVTNGAQTQTLATSPTTTSLTATFANLLSDGASHTVLVSLPGCSTTSTTYTAPASCSVVPSGCNLNAVVTAGLCSTATNTYSVSVVVNLTNAQSGNLIVDAFGADSGSQPVSAGTSSVTFVFSGLIPDGLNRIVKVSLPGCGTTSAAFTAPTACTATPAPVCSLSAVATAGLCQTAINTYSSRVVITLVNPTTGTLTVTNGGQTQTLLTSPATTSLTATFANLLSDGASHTILVSLPGCSTTSTTYTAPASCSVAPVCSISAVATAGLCSTATNTYSALVVVNLANAQAGTLTVSIPGATSVSQVVSSGSSSLTLTLPGLLSDGVSHTATVSLPGCGTTTATFTAPTSCSVAPICSLSAVATASLCQTATNSYSSTVVISLTNPTTGTLTVTNGAQTQTLLTNPTTTSLTATFSNLPSDGASHTVVVSLPGCSTTSTTYTAPVSCSVAPVCSISAVATAGLCVTATNTYSASVVVSLTNSTAGTLSVNLPGVPPSSQTVSSGTNAVTLVLDGLISDGASHTVTVSLPGCGTTTATFTAPVSCSVAPVCSISAVATPGICASATNTFTTIAVITLTNPTTGTLTVTDGPTSLTFATISGSSASFTATLANIVSNGASHTLTATLSGCSSTSTTYTAPTSCSIAPVCSISAAVTAGLCATATNTYSATALISLANAQDGVVILSIPGAAPISQTITASTTSLTAIFSELLSDGASHTVTVSLPGCSTTTALFTAPLSCTSEIGLSITDPGVCQPGTNTYTTTGVISLTNALAGTALISDGTNTVSLSVSAGATSVPYSMSGLISGTGTHTVTVSYLGQISSTTYTAPESCTTASICSISAVATAGLCQTATNTYSSNVVISLTNPITGTLTVTNGAQTQTLLTSPATTSLTATFANLPSDGASHTILVSLPGCSTTSTTYTAPASCSVAPVCSISAVATA